MRQCTCPNSTYGRSRGLSCATTRVRPVCARCSYAPKAGVLPPSVFGALFVSAARIIPRRAAFTSPSFPRGLLTHFRFDCFQRLCTANAHVVRMLLETFNQFTAPWSDARTYLLRVGLTVRKGSTTLGSGRWSRKRD